MDMSTKYIDTDGTWISFERICWKLLICCFDGKRLTCMQKYLNIFKDLSSILLSGNGKNNNLNSK